ncbi:succinylglutamate desuccinylase/aspartoacylase family protein [Mangrovimonas sp. AS39]|uniref:succinylglutamate desuccinylase/aspartoacylase family protein n=1 Tax=Mangrovimonas futianensis TaxID=2895523 RepID=UPI001E2C61B4|nr:succinylglutamate desuccinylase/aspartoacylase family protein [Mangrovimonas futianensis]MCF1190543.1 succinylglutamate desuccinylase/aspartoacylase family protein [Mangrovimonas futianensis]MCF1193705.1 succinylglutamate desuccinylase/aspartoacylase family protein [Mangrovimonas futianensis]
MTDSQKTSIHVLGKEIREGERCELRFDVANLHTSSSVDVPVIIERSKKPGPVVLITGGLHGDEVNGVEIVRQIISLGINKPKRGTIICLPVINVFGFINLTREFPDGRDLNRVFPGTKKGSLASRVAYKLVNEVIPDVDFIMDFHTGGAGRFNAPQIRIVKNDPELDHLAQVFNAPFVLYSKNIKKSFRNVTSKLGIPMLLFEGGKSNHIDPQISATAVEGIKRTLKHLDMLSTKFKVTRPRKKPVFILTSRWQRANFSGMFKATITVNSLVSKGDVLGHITDPYGKFIHPVKAFNSGYIINVNESPIVYQGDALFHITTKLK